MVHYNCCVSHCTNSFRNASYLHYYRIPKDPDVRKKYVVLIGKGTLTVNSESTRNGTLILCKRFILFWFENMLIDHVIENTL